MNCTHEHYEEIVLDETTLEFASNMCFALSDKNRLRLLLILSEREMCVSELVELDSGKLSTTSARLQLLYNAKLVNRRRDAKHIFYSLADSHVHDLVKNIYTHSMEQL